MAVLPPCLGRRDLLAQISSGLTARRWVTLVGPPGVGKTLLARHTAAAFAPAAWIDAKPFTDLDDLLAQCLSVLDPDTAPGDSASLALKRALDESGRLLVLDGLTPERHQGLGKLIESIMASTTLARVLCTAATPADSPLEVCFEVEPLPVPAPTEPIAGAAVDLFVGRLAGAGGDFLDLHGHGPALRRLLDASGGLPLLIEQLAVQAAMLGIDAVVPTGSLAGAVAASYGMVDELSQRGYRRLAVMAVPVGMDVLAELIEAPRAMAAGVAARLVRHNLAQQFPDGRLGMLDPVRRHGLDLAVEAGDEVAAQAAILRWADRAIPAGEDEGRGDAAWFTDLDTVTAAVSTAAASPDTLDLAYRLANRAFGSLYTAMRPREALELLEMPLSAGEGPPEIGAQAARRAGICASEVRGTFEGLRFLDLAEEHARRTPSPGVQLARTSSIRAEMYLDAGQFERARAEVDRTLANAGDDSYAFRQTYRTLMDVEVSEGRLAAAEALAGDVIDGTNPDEYWLALAARILLAQIAFEQGRALEAAAMARAARDESRDMAEDRIALLAEVLLRRITGEPATLTPDIERLPWAVRLGYQLQEARDVLAAGEFARAAGLAADVIVLADASRLERDGVAARIVAGDALLAAGDKTQALSTYAAAARRAAACPMPLRLADAFGGMALALADTRPEQAGRCLGTAIELRRVRGAVRLPRVGVNFADLPPVRPPGKWVVDGELSDVGLAVTVHLAQSGAPEAGSSVAAALTKAQFAVAELVGQGLTSKEIAGRLYLSPRTVDNHLAQIYRRLDITSRSRLAALMVDSHADVAFG